VMQLLLAVPGASSGADDLYWDSELILVSDFDLLNGQRIAVDGDEVFVVYTEQQHGWECSVLMWYNGTGWSDPMYVAGDTRNANEP
ncbi:MAG: hypothetical protein GWN18_15060, partial [Thermoplasmata archaeon]|nr:hypothetical protein [Thermoplasmata archaeon]NIV36537.1 hypothetical protein [Anaerolineae bacterium]NIS12947.1 hypothetical protein [Thermoplasmata archaeon]NIS21267.1 hypothetical protein [Thermoplasmata archaeon]NIT78273.1 hypothetical protein [Thermoplasmata archaeon]